MVEASAAPAPARPPAPARLLVIGYGNTLRSDDGLGPRLAEAVRDARWPGVEALPCAQLTPELAEPISRSEAVVFVDAAAGGPPAVRLRPAIPGPSSRILAHASSPETLLALARDAYGRAPRAWYLTAPAANLGFGEKLSNSARWAFGRALRKLDQLRAVVAPPGAAATAIRAGPPGAAAAGFRGRSAAGR